MIRFRHVLVLLTVLLAWGCTATVPVDRVPPTSLEAVGLLSERLSLPKGYLDPEALPDSLSLLPPPPQQGSAALAADQEAFELAMQAPAEMQAIATVDAELEWSILIRPFEEILGTSLSDGSKPHTEMLLKRSIVDAGLSTYRAKNHYKRIRPLWLNSGWREPKWRSRTLFDLRPPRHPQSKSGIDHDGRRHKAPGRDLNNERLNFIKNK